MLLIELDAKEYKGDGEESMAASTIRVFWDRPGEMGAGLVRTKGGKIISVKCRK